MVHSSPRRRSKDIDFGPKPPTNYQEFIEQEEIEQWPLPFDEFENDLDMSNYPCWTVEELRDEILEDCEVGSESIEKMNARFKELKERLEYFQSFLFSQQTKQAKAKKSPGSNQDKDILAVKLRQQDLHVLESSESEGMRRVDRVVFPGFHKREVTELPGRLEAPQILNQITEAQNFNKGFSQAWKALFFSQASTALLHDSFWWIFLFKFQAKQQGGLVSLHHQQPNAYQKVMDEMFTRIADSYVALFASAHPDIKDKFFREYPRCLAQSVYVVFYKAFPDSEEEFTKDFADEIFSMVCEWFTGLTRSSQDNRKWPWDKLIEPSKLDPVTELLERTQKISFKLDLPKLGEDMKEAEVMRSAHSSRPTSASSLLPPTDSETSLATTTAPTTSKALVRFEDSQATVNEEAFKKLSNELVPFELSPALRKQTPEQRTASRLFRSEQKMARSIDVERVSFNIRGCTPLVSHHLYIKQLQTRQRFGRTVRRSETSKPLNDHYEEGWTLEDVLKKSRNALHQMQVERKRTEETTRAEIEKARKIFAKSVQDVNTRLKKASKLEAQLASQQIVQASMQTNPNRKSEITSSQGLKLKVHKHL